MSSSLNVSLPVHLVSLLTALHPTLPAELQSQLSPYLANPTPPTLPYDLLLSLSKYARSPECPLSPENKREYEMVSLLAGCTTSPERSFPQSTPTVGGVQIKAEYEPEYSKRDERKAITALVNAVGSVIGSGVAAYWASSHTGWRDEWRVLFALFAGFVVAASEGILYLIWTSRRDSALIRKQQQLIIRDKKALEDASQQVPEEEAQTTAKVPKAPIRKRKAKKAN